MADSPLQAAPQGLLGAFNLKTLGDNPSIFGGSVQPVVEAMGFYGLPKRSFQLATGNLQNPGDILTLTVPAGQVWRVLAASGRAVIGALDVSGFVAMLGTRPTNNPTQSIVAIAQANIPQPATPVTLHVAVCSGLVEPFYLGPGAELVLYIGAAFNAARSCSIQAIVEVFDV